MKAALVKVLYLVSALLFIYEMLEAPIVLGCMIADRRDPVHPGRLEGVYPDLGWLVFRWVTIIWTFALARRMQREIIDANREDVGLPPLQ